MRAGMKRKLAGLLSLLMAYTMLMNGQAAIPVRAEDTDATITVSFQEGSSANGKVQINTASGWVDYSPESDQQLTPCTASAVRIVPNEGYQIVMVEIGIL